MKWSVSLSKHVFSGGFLIAGICLEDIGHAPLDQDWHECGVWLTSAKQCQITFQFYFIKLPQPKLVPCSHRNNFRNLFGAFLWSESCLYLLWGSEEVIAAFVSERQQFWCYAKHVCKIMTNCFWLHSQHQYTLHRTQSILYRKEVKSKRFRSIWELTNNHWLHWLT